MAILLYHGSRLLARILLFPMTRKRVMGRANVPKKGPLLIVANHMNIIDVPLLATSLGIDTLFMAKKELFHSRLLGYIFRCLGSFPVHRGQMDRRALRQAIQILSDGHSLVLFPEGMRSHQAKLQPAFSGSALIALHSKATILPVGITGTEKTKGIAWILHRPKITVNIGKPFHLSPVNGRLTKSKLTGATRIIMYRIAEVLPPEYQGHYTEREKEVSQA